MNDSSLFKKKSNVIHQSSGKTTDFSLVTYEGLNLILIHLNGALFLQSSASSFRCTSIQSTPDGLNKVPALHCFLLDNHFHSDEHHNAEEKLLKCN